MNNNGIVFLSGAGLGPFIWKPLISYLEFPTLLIQYPPNAANENNSIDNYIQFISEQIDQSDFREFYIICHSIGGILALPLNDVFHGKVKGLIGISSVIPQTGKNFLSCLPAPNRWLISLLIELLGTKPPESSIKKGLCNGLTDKQIDEVLLKFRTESKRLYFDACDYTHKIRNYAYITCKFDNEIALVTQQKMAERIGATRVYELESGHLPMMSHPKKLAAIIDSYINQVNQYC